MVTTEMHINDHTSLDMEIPPGQCPFISPVEIGHNAHMQTHIEMAATKTMGTSNNILNSFYNLGYIIKTI